MDFGPRDDVGLLRGGRTVPLAPLLCSVSETGMGDFSAGPSNLFCGCCLFVGGGLCTIHIVPIAKSVVPKMQIPINDYTSPGG